MKKSEIKKLDKIYVTEKELEDNFHELVISNKDVYVTDKAPQPFQVLPFVTNPPKRKRTAAEIQKAWDELAGSMPNFPSLDEIRGRKTRIED